MDNQNENLYTAYRNKYLNRRSRLRRNKRSQNHLANQFNEVLSHINQNSIDPNLSFPSIPPQPPQPAPSIGMPGIGPVGQFSVPEDFLRQMDNLKKQNESLQSDIEYYKSKIISLEQQIYVFYKKLIQIEGILPNILSNSINSNINPNMTVNQQQQQQSFQQIFAQQQQQQQLQQQTQMNLQGQ